MNQFKMQCLCCDKPLEPVTTDAPYQPNDGVICDTSGNYGSTVFDAGFGERLVFFLCDGCLVAKKERVLYYGPTRNHDHQPMDRDPEPVPWPIAPEPEPPVD